jgi:hypothetical protein
MVDLRVKAGDQSEGTANAGAFGAPRSTPALNPKAFLACVWMIGCRRADAGRPLEGLGGLPADRFAAVRTHDAKKAPNEPVNVSYGRFGRADAA